MIYAIDTETTGLKHSHGARAFCITYTDDNGKPQIAHIGEDSLLTIDVMTLNTDNEFVGHNIGFDLPFLADFGIVPKKIHDTMIMAHVHNNLEPAKDLSSLAKKYCDMSNPEEEKLEQWFADHNIAKDKRQYADVPREIMDPYALADVRMTMALFRYYKKQGVLENPAYKTEMELVPVVAAMSARGMCVDVPYAKAEFDKAVATLADLAAQALEFGVDNVDSNEQLADALFTRGGLKCVTFTEKDNICLDENALSQYEHPLIGIVLKHRELAKLCKTYLAAIVEKSVNGRLYSSIRQVGARTGRMSSSDPNLQNIPRNDDRSPLNLRKAFTCTKDCKMLLIDLSQIELRLLAHYSKEKKMIDVLTQREGDLHMETARNMFAKDGEVTKRHRTVAKTMNFAIIYGAGSFALVEQLNKALPDNRIDFAQAKDFKTRYLDGYPDVKQFLWDVQNRINERGYVEGKSKRKYFCEKESAYRAANYLIQGEAAMLMKRMMVDVEKYLKGKRTCLVNVIHDELIFDLHKDEEYLIPELLKVIESQDGWRVPIFANADITQTTWADKEKFLHQ